ncbi:metallophosphoesterase [Terriglobus albidus]|uniref:metallophosphoesterase n=1 Tax=Terriglobus albidus TaxID=1592106 RepID=UPI0021E068E9|nr:metallophosphoesterase [Terriglobus albidus]
MIKRLLTSLTVALAAHYAASAQDQFFLQMSDPQFGMYTANASFAQETANLEFAIATANRLHPAFVVISGDLVNKPGEPAQIAEYLRITHQLDAGIPLYSIPGNHDVGNVPTPENLAAYRKTFGRDYYSFRHGAMEGIVLNSSIIQHPEQVMDEEVKQREWLEAELKKAVAEHVQWIVVFQHIPWFLHDADEPDQYFNIPRSARTRYLKILKDNGVRYNFAGHLHQNSFGTDGAFEMITTGPVGKPLGNASSGIRIVSIGKDRLCYPYFGLGNLPNKVESDLCNEDRH